MLDRFADLYARIGSALRSALPPDWTTSWTSVEMDARGGAVFVYYRAEDGAIRWIRPPLALYDLFRRLHEAARRESETGVWTTATFVLERDGTFTLDLGCDAIPIEEETARRAAWRERYLPRPR